MKIASLFQTNARQNHTLILQLVVVVVSWCFCYLISFSFGTFLITQISFNIALIYSNKDFLKYTVPQCNYITVLLILFYALLSYMIESFEFTNESVIDTLFSYIIITTIIKSTQKQVGVGLIQLVVLMLLLSAYFLFVYKKPGFGYPLKNAEYYMPFFINQILASIYAVSLFSTADNSHAQKNQEEDGLVNMSLPKKKSDLLGFTVLIVTFSGMLIFFYLLYAGLTMFPHSHSKDIMIADFEANPKLFYGIKNYANSIDPQHKIREIEFEFIENKFFSITINGTDATNGSHDMESWQPADSLLKATPWTKQTLTALKEKLDKVNCRSIKTGEPFVIGHESIDAQRFYYNLFNKPPDSSYNDICRYVRYNDTVVLEFKHISKFDSECFPN